MSINRRRFLQAGAVASGLFFADSVGFERYFVEVKEYFINDASEKDDNLKIIQISDLHMKSLRYPHKQIAKKVNKAKPDLIAITGDCFDRLGKLGVLDRFLKLMDKDVPKVAILGNWEHWCQQSIADLKTMYTANNCTLLINETKQFSLKNKTLSITGVDDFVAGSPDIDEALRHYQKSDYHVILNHCPQYSDTISTKLIPETPVDFILSGHTHGGQINFFGLTPFRPYGSGKYIKGWYNDNVPRMYVSRGIGTTLIPVRFGSRAEIAIFNLKA